MKILRPLCPAASSVSALALVVCFMLASIGVMATRPALVRADATVLPQPAYSAAPGLPDGRVYEQVSPPNKHGNYAGVYQEGLAKYALAGADGNELLFEGSGVMGSDAVEAVSQMFIARRSLGGWSTSAGPPAEVDVAPNLVSSDLSQVVFSAARVAGPISEGDVSAPPAGDPDFSPNLYLDGPDFSGRGVWLTQPTIPDPSVPLAGSTEIQEFHVAGGSPDLSTVYFTFPGMLVAEDAPRAPYVSQDGENKLGNNYAAQGLYEWRAGVGLRSAGVLPDGLVSPFGAVDAAEPDVGRRGFANGLNNAVSADGSRVWFVSPDPDVVNVCLESGAAPAECEPQLYLRTTEGEGASERRSTVLVSESQLPGSEREPAPSGPFSDGGTSPYVYASADGSHAFFASTDRLTSAAPANALVKEYEFDADTRTLTYLPGVADLPASTSPILSASSDGSRFLFVKYGEGGPQSLDLWTAGPSGATVSQIAQLPASPAEAVAFPSTRVSSDGSVFVFSTSSPLPGFNNSPGYLEIYRYEIADNTLSCVSCPPRGTLPTGDATLANDDNGSAGYGVGDSSRGISSNGDRVFFDTPDPLVAQDTDGQRDVYEWEDGEVYLLSSGHSPDPSVLLDSSASGDDAFFATSDALSPGDTDGGYDVYDTRVPRPGDNPPAAEVPCQGDVCQGPPSTPLVLGAPASSTFSGLGNPLQQASKPAAKAKAKPLTRAQLLAAALKACAKRAKDARHHCQAQAKAKYRASTKTNSDKGSK